MNTAADVEAKVYYVSMIIRKGTVRTMTVFYSSNSSDVVMSEVFCYFIAFDIKNKPRNLNANPANRATIMGSKTFK